MQLQTKREADTFHHIHFVRWCFFGAQCKNWWNDVCEEGKWIISRRILCSATTDKTRRKGVGAILGSYRSGTFHLIYCWWKAEDLMNDVGFPPAGVGKSLSGRSCHKDTVMSSCQICTWESFCHQLFDGWLLHNQMLPWKDAMNPVVNLVAGFIFSGLLALGWYIASASASASSSWSQTLELQWREGNNW